MKNQKTRPESRGNQSGGAGRLLILLALSFMLSGSLGLTMPQDCAASERPADGMKCLYAAAITQAYLCGATQRGTQLEGNSYSSASCSPALMLCEEIFTRYGTTTGSGGSQTSQLRKAETMANTCYFEVAKITRDSFACTYITQRLDTGTQLSGSITTQDMCLDQTAALERLAPENYYSSNPNNICAVIFVFPFLLAISARCP